MKLGDSVKVYGGNSIHDATRIFSNGLEMTILDLISGHGANWAKLVHIDLNEHTVFEYWFLQEQLVPIQP